MRTDSDLEPYPSLWPPYCEFFFFELQLLHIHRPQGKQNKLLFFPFVRTVCTLPAPDFEIFPPDTNVPLTPQDKTFHTDRDRESAFTHGCDGLHRLFIEVNLDQPIRHT